MEKSSFIAFLIWKSAWHHVRTSMASPCKFHALSMLLLYSQLGCHWDPFPCAKMINLLNGSFCCVHCGPYRARSWDRSLLLTLQMGKHCKNIYRFECDHPLSSQHFLSATCQQSCSDILFHEQQVCCRTSTGHFSHIRINLSGIYMK